MRLSPNFTLAEMSKSAEALRKGWRNDPDTEQTENLRALCDHVLQPVRGHFGRPVVVNSGFRSSMLNASIGGSSSSQHMRGEAADIEIPGVSNYDVAAYILTSGLVFDQLILEFPSRDDPAAGWVHVSFRRDGMNRGQALTAIKVEDGAGKVRTRFMPGLVL